MAISELPPGAVLLGKYRVESLIAEGGMGRVVKAHHLQLDQTVAIKLLLPDMAKDDGTVQRFVREGQASVKLRGEHVCRVLDVGVLSEGTPYMVMEFLDGADLGAILRHYGKQDPRVSVDMMLQACEGLAEAHQAGIIHRDIKPSNFYITRRPDGSPLLKILDFGIASAPAGVDSELTATQVVIGTPAYMAPEQMRSARAADPRSDIWSIGVVLHEMVSGERPFDSESYGDLCLKIGMEPPTPITVPLPDGLIPVILRCLEKQPDRRFQNAAELAWALVPLATSALQARTIAERCSRILGVSPKSMAPTIAIQAPEMPPPGFQVRAKTTPTSVSGSAGEVEINTLRKDRGFQWRSGNLIVAGSIAVVLVLVGGLLLTRNEKDSGNPKAVAGGTTDGEREAKLAAEKAAADKAAFDKAVAEAAEKAAAERAAADKAAAERAAAEKAAADKAAAEKLSEAPVRKLTSKPDEGTRRKPRKPDRPKPPDDKPKPKEDLFGDRE